MRGLVVLTGAARGQGAHARLLVEHRYAVLEPTGGSSSTAPLGRRARADEISPLVAHLVGEDAAFVTGSVLTIDGGLTAA